MDSFSNSSYGYNPNPSFQSDFKRLFDPFSHRAINGVMLGGSALSDHWLVLDSEKGELVKVPTIVGKKGVSSDAKALAALKNHSEAERRRRERINAHLTTLRGLVPCTGRMDKAALLAEVLSQLKEMKKKVVEITSQGFLIPMDADEVRVEPCDIDGADDHDAGTTSYRASLCCDYRPQLFSDLRQVVDSLQLEMAKEEISTLGSRVKHTFVFTCCKGGCINNIEESKGVVSSVHQALSSVLDKASANIPECSPTTSTHEPSKRPRVSLQLDTSCSSSSS